MPLKRLGCAATCCLLLSATPAAQAATAREEVPADAGDAPLARVGARVRFKRSDRNMKTLTGALLSFDDQTLRLEVRAGADAVVVQRANIRDLEVSLGSYHRTKAGAIIGASILGGVALLLSYIAWGIQHAEHRGSPFHEHAAFVLAGGGIGAILGGSFGSAVITEEWAASNPRRFSAQVAPTRHGLAASVTLRF